MSALALTLLAAALLATPPSASDDWPDFFREPPPLSDLSSLPPPTVVSAARHVGTEYMLALKKRQTMEPARWSELQAALEATAANQEAWDCLAYAQHQEWHDWFRQEMLDRLRKQLGPTAYATGRMPPPIPLWCCRRLGD
jgi:hypothetical protein